MCSSGAVHHSDVHIYRAFWEDLMKVRKSSVLQKTENEILITRKFNIELAAKQRKIKWVKADLVQAPLGSVLLCYMISVTL